MLKRLGVTQFAIIEQASLSFTTGFNVLTGETGAGKSILIDALNAVLGGRASLEWVRQGADAFRVEAVFSHPWGEEVESLLKEQEIPREDEELILVRRYSTSGKSRALINGCQVPLAVLRQLGLLLADMHGQHENQTVLDPAFQLFLLDSFAPEITPLMSSYRQSYDRWKMLTAEKRKLEAQEQEREQRMDLLRWQLQEINQGALQKGEDQELAQQEQRLANAEKLAASLERAVLQLNGNEEETPGALALLYKARQELEQINRFDDCQEQCKVLDDFLYQLEDVSAILRERLEEIEYNPQKLGKIQERLSLLQKLKRKYGPELEDVLNYAAQAQEELDSLLSGEDRLAELSRECEAVQEEAWIQARRLHAKRRQTAPELEAKLASHLQDLGMTPTLQFAIDETSELGPDGCDRVELLFSANTGETPKALQKIASGGELSRLALAIKSVGAACSGTPTMIFDEIDSGLGGRAAQQVADKIAAIAQSKQVLCITHLPQLALVADRHIHLVKEEVDGRTQTRPVRLEEFERVNELARMFYGDAVTPELLSATARLLEQYQQQDKK
ncbi:DNA repair protein RecN [Anaeroarcus burkinensis]|uniref:DNA repair protein RecN n=1 Tax=Anaeroarcus burkinensis TaxID=82376 RepID=UPI00040285B8|nr:DNA repair protein RecN [Anaeroarcus burkinensis]